ncbi:hypothetical protein [Halobacillus mangrovi]|uniref:Uncharacterized protein n=1 Tax=Halobacillus mangrovi TaxID=402384 RepID=A0A1W5ZS44_9BACI|nr:hypothetical protein [Halobacillus mangrovi]ARI76109.1 hypothetical protein HM131_04330 [Halobacillus mangrovi]
MEIRFDSINVYMIEKSSGIFVGPNIQYGWRTQQKENVGLGKVIGEGNILTQNINVIHDEDMVDMPIKKEAAKESKKANGIGQGES